MDIKNMNKFDKISQAVKTAVTNDANEKALEVIISSSVEKEVQLRSDLLIKGLEAWEKTKKDINKCRPDQKFYPVDTNDDGSDKETDVKQEFYSEAKKKELDNLKQKLGQLDAALIKALGENQDYEALKKIVNSSK